MHSSCHIVIIFSPVVKTFNIQYSIVKFSHHAVYYITMIHSSCHWRFIPFDSVQFSSVAQLCPTLCNPMNRSTPGLPVHHQLPEITQTHVHRVSDPAISSSVVPFSSCPQSLPASESFPMSRLFS